MADRQALRTGRLPDVRAARLLRAPGLVVVAVCAEILVIALAVPRWGPPAAWVGAGTLALLIVLVGGYVDGWRWTGLANTMTDIDSRRLTVPSKTLWDWLQLLIVPAVLSLGVYWLNERQSTVDRETARNAAEDTVLNGYIDAISTLLADKKLGTAQAKSGVATVADTRTQIALQRLDPARQSLLLHFASSAHLMRLIYLNGADLQGVNLSEDHLEGAHLAYIHLEGADLSYAHLQGAHMYGAHLMASHLYRADLRGARLCTAHLEHASLRFADLRGANLSGAHLDGATLQGAQLHHAHLEGARLKGATIDLAKALSQGVYLNGPAVPCQ